MAKLGWDPSKGLGADGSGRTTHITVAQKLNLLGIGANAKQGADDIAWKQSKDYEMLLKRLNEDNQEKGEVETAEVKSSEDKKLKKRKREDDGNSSDELKKKRKKEKERKDKGDKEKKGKKSKKEQKDKRKERSKKECSDSSASGSDEEAAEGDKAEDVPVATIDESHSIVHVPRPIAYVFYFESSSFTHTNLLFRILDIEQDSCALRNLPRNLLQRSPRYLVLLRVQQLLRSCRRRLLHQTLSQHQTRL